MSEVTIDARSDWRWHVVRAPHHRALGTTRVHLVAVEFDPVLYGNVFMVAPGGTSRCGCKTDAAFVARDPASGLEFAWSLNLERRGVGYGDLSPDLDTIMKVAAALPRERKGDFFLIIDGMVSVLTATAEQHSEKATLLWAAVAQANAIRRGARS